MVDRAEGPALKFRLLVVGWSWLDLRSAQCKCLQHPRALGKKRSRRVASKINRLARVERLFGRQDNPHGADCILKVIC